MMMLRILDDCLDGAFSRSKAWRELRDQLYARAKPWADKFETSPAPEQAEAEAAEAGVIGAVSEDSGG